MGVGRGGRTVGQISHLGIGQNIIFGHRPKDDFVWYKSQWAIYRIYIGYIGANNEIFPTADGKLRSFCIFIFLDLYCIIQGGSVGELCCIT